MSQGLFWFFFVGWIVGFIGVLLRRRLTIRKEPTREDLGWAIVWSQIEDSTPDRRLH